MKSSIRIILLFAIATLSQHIFAQANSLELNPEKEKNYTPFMLKRHGGKEGLASFKQSNPHQYLKELWYYSESFYVKRNYAAEGIALNETQIDISRFEGSRKENEESVILLPGYKDALVLLPNSKLIYKP